MNSPKNFDANVHSSIIEPKKVEINPTVHQLMNEYNIAIQ